MSWERLLNEDADARAFRPNAAARGLIGGKYEVIAELGRGGFGTVLQARHAGLNKLVAIKVLHNALLVDEVNRARFELEAKAGANLSHPNLVSVFDYGFTERDEPYLVMEFVEGVSLEQFLMTPSPPVDDLLDILMQVGKALRYLHDSKIVHRDLKTSNILVQNIGGERYARLLDLGIAKVFSANNSDTNVQLTSTGVIFGSPAFMSPEQCQGQQIDARSDIYSFGCVIYQCMAGEIPFSGENSLQVILKHLHETPKALSYKTQRQYELTQVVSKCMAKDPAQRYQSMKELLEVLQKIAIAPPNEKTQIRQDNLSRSYSELPTGGSGNNWQPIIGGIAAVALIMLAVACVIPLWGVIQKQISPGVDYSVHDSVKATPNSASVMQQVVETQQPGNSGSVQPERSEVTSSAAAERLRKLEEAAAEQKAAAERERAAAEQQRIAAEKDRAAAAAERVAAAEKRAAEAEQREAASKAVSDHDMATRELWLEKTRAFAKANEARFDAIRQQQKALSAMDQATQAVQSSNRTVRQYNDRVAQPGGAGR